jgi:hypothetical protein
MNRLVAEPSADFRPSPLSHLADAVKRNQIRFVVEAKDALAVFALNVDALDAALLHEAILQAPDALVAFVVDLGQQDRDIQPNVFLRHSQSLGRSTISEVQGFRL